MADDDPPDNVIPFPVDDQQAFAWACACGCSIVRPWVSGELECLNCGEPLPDLRVIDIES